jgi:phospho-N-acetylmuramoyl-pentapeptide-transferase
MMSLDIIKVLLPSLFSFLCGILLSPFLADFLYKKKLWKKKSVEKTIDGREATISSMLHNDEAKKTPRLGGIIIWFSVFATALSLWAFSKLFPGPITEKFDFISRSQTWLPLFAMLIGAIVGAIDDLLVADFFKKKGSYVGGGLSFPIRLFTVACIGLFAGYWFYEKLGVQSVFVPFYGDFHLGLFYIPFFIIVTVAIFSTSVIDGIDGLSGGIFATIFSSVGIITFLHGQINIATLCFVIVGAILGFLWFNVPPALFYMTETGILALTLALSVISFMADITLYLLIIALPLFVTSGSVILQLLSKKYRGKKIFLVAPLHHHFEAKGWSRATITMRYWIVSSMCALMGIVLVLLTYVK